MKENENVGKIKNKNEKWKEKKEVNTLMEALNGVKAYKNTT